MSSNDKPERPAAPIDSLKRQYDILEWCSKMQDQIDESRELAVQAIKDALGENEIGTIDGKPAVQWIKSYPKRFNSKRFRSDYPGLWDQYSMKPEEPVRTFSLVKEK